MIVEAINDNILKNNQKSKKKSKSKILPKKSIPKRHTYFLFSIYPKKTIPIHTYLNRPPYSIYNFKRNAIMASLGGFKKLTVFW